MGDRSPPHARSAAMATEHSSATRMREPFANSVNPDYLRVRSDSGNAAPQHSIRTCRGTVNRRSLRHPQTAHRRIHTWKPFVPIVTASGRRDMPRAANEELRTDGQHTVQHSVQQRPRQRDLHQRHGPHVWARRARNRGRPARRSGSATRRASATSYSALGWIGMLLFFGIIFGTLYAANAVAQRGNIALGSRTLPRLRDSMGAVSLADPD